MYARQPASGHDKAPLRVTRKCAERAFDVVGLVRVDRPYVHSERRRYRLNSASLSAAGARRGIANYCDARNCGRDLLEKFQPFGTDAELELRKAGSISSRPRQGLDHTGADGVSDVHKYDWHAPARPLQCGSYC